MIEFTKEEQISFLQRIGYEVVDYKWIEYVPVYHNNTEEVERSVKLAIPNDIPYENFIKGKSLDNLAPYSEWTMSSVFNREIKKRILNL